MRVGLTGLLLLATMASPGIVQDGGHTNSDPHKCKICAPSLAKAMAYVKKTYGGSGLPGHVYAGFAFMMDDTGQYSGDLKNCVNYCKGSIRSGGFNGNWYLGMSMFFLAEYCTRYPDGEVQKALHDSIDYAAKNQEETGGWCHHLKMWQENNYNKIGGGKDLGMVTSMIFGAFLEMKAMGIDPGPIMERAQKNLESISDGQGFSYGTDNKWGDICMSRASYVLLGILAAKRQDHPFTQKIISGIKSRYKSVEKGHAFGPLHYFGIAAALHRLGPGDYQKFTDEYLSKLMSSQKDDGVVEMRSDGGTRKDADKFMDSAASTAVYCCILLLQKPGVFVPKQPKKDESTAKKDTTFNNKGQVTEKPWVPDDFKDSAQQPIQQTEPPASGGGMAPDPSEKK